MNYQDTVNWMFQQLPMYQNQGKSAFRAKLDNTLALAAHLGNPQNKFKSIHVAGTNGKGSTSHMLASVLQEAGYKVGLYTSPHLKDFRERIKINGKEISEAEVVQFIQGHQAFLATHSFSFFEMTVGMAFDHFAAHQVDIAVIEVGMGGRLDSTNIITPVVSVITNIGLDHTQFLGHSLSAIAAEKAGIIKANIPVVISQWQEETAPVFKERATVQNAPISFAEELNLPLLESGLEGDYQQKNIKGVLAALYILIDNGWQITKQNIAEGLLKVVANTGLRGRWEVLQQHPKVICDTGHNADGLRIAMGQLAREPYKQLHMVFGVVADKDLASILELLPKNAFYYYCRPNIPRGMAVEDLQKSFTEAGFVGKSFSSVATALNAATQEAGTEDVIYVGGSTFVVAEIL